MGFSATLSSPDILFIRNENGHIIKKNFIEGGPDLIIEILRPGNEKLDRHTKLKHYATFGVGEYCIIDYEVRILEQYVRMGDTFERKGIFGEAFSPSLFSNLSINLYDVFKGPGF